MQTGVSYSKLLFNPYDVTANLDNKHVDGTGDKHPFSTLQPFQNTTSFSDAGVTITIFSPETGPSPVYFRGGIMNLIVTPNDSELYATHFYELAFVWNGVDPGFNIPPPNLDNFGSNTLVTSHITADVESQEPLISGTPYFDINGISGADDIQIILRLPSTPQTQALVKGTYLLM